MPLNGHLRPRGHNGVALCGTPAACGCCRRGHCKGNITKPLLVLDYTALNHMCWYFHAPKVAKKRAHVRKEAYGKYHKRHWWSKITLAGPQ